MLQFVEPSSENCARYPVIGAFVVARTALQFRTIAELLALKVSVGAEAGAVVAVFVAVEADLPR